MKKFSIDIIIPVYYRNFDELESSIIKQLNYFRKNFKNHKWKIVVGINGPKGEIYSLAKNLSKKYKEVDFSYTSTPGRGATLKDTWYNSKADIVSYMDVDLSTNLDCFKSLVKEIANGYDVVVGSKYIKGSRYKRTLFRLVVSKIYNVFFAKIILNAKFTDAQCGFKAMKQSSARKLIPLIKDDSWFFDTELLYLAQKLGYKIKEIPVDWLEYPNSGVNMGKTIVTFLRKSIELRLRH